MLKCFCEEPLSLEPNADRWYTTSCGHIFHYVCLTGWIERSKTCPQCRKSVDNRQMFRLYPALHQDSQRDDDIETLQASLNTLQSQLRDMTKKCKEKDVLIIKIKDVADFNEKRAHAVKNEFETATRKISGLEQKINDLEQNLNQFNWEIKQLRKNNLDLGNKLINTESSARAAKDELENAKHVISYFETKTNQLKVERNELQKNNLDLGNKLKVAELDLIATQKGLANSRYLIVFLEERLEALEERKQISKRLEEIPRLQI